MKEFMPLTITHIRPASSTSENDWTVFNGHANPTDAIKWDYYDVVPSTNVGTDSSITDREYEVFIYDNNMMNEGKLGYTNAGFTLTLSNYGFPKSGGEYYIQIHEFYSTGSFIESIPIIGNLNKIIINNINPVNSDTVVFTATPNTTTQSSPQYVQLGWNIISARSIESISIESDKNISMQTPIVNYIGRVDCVVTESTIFTLKVKLNSIDKIITTAAFTFNVNPEEGTRFSISNVMEGDRVAVLNKLYEVIYTPIKINKLELYFIYKENNLDRSVLASTELITLDMYNKPKTINVVAKYFDELLEKTYGVSGSLGYVITDEDNARYPLKIIETFKLINP